MPLHKNKIDLLKILYSARLFSEDSRMSHSKRKRMQTTAIKFLLTALALLSLLYFNLLDLGIKQLLKTILMLILFCGAGSLILIIHYLLIRTFWKKKSGSF